MIFQEMTVLMDIMWSYLHDNQRRYYEGWDLEYYDDLSEEQLLSIPGNHFMVKPLIRRCARIGSVLPLERIDWNDLHLFEYLVEVGMSTFHSSVMDYAMDVITTMPLDVMYDIKPRVLFSCDKVTCKEACDWYRAHDLWDGDAIEEAIAKDDAEWFAHEVGNDPVGHSHKVIDHASFAPNILCWLATQMDLTNKVGNIFVKTYFSEDAKRVYDAIGLNVTQPLFIEVIYGREWFKFVLNHFEILNSPQELMELCKNLYDSLYMFVAMKYELPIPDWNFSRCVKHLDDDDSKQLYDYNPDIFHVDITAVNLYVNAWRFAMNHGAYVTLPVICLRDHVIDFYNITPADYLYDTRLDESIVKNHVNKLINGKNLSYEETEWLAYTMTRYYPAKNWRYTTLIMDPTLKDWKPWIAIIAPFVNWSVINVNNLLQYCSKWIAKLHGYIDIHNLFHIAIVENIQCIRDLHIGCMEEKIDIQMDKSMLEHYWPIMSETNQKALLFAFPQQCMHLEPREKQLHTYQNIMKKRKM